MDEVQGEQSSEMTEVLSHVPSEAQLPLANPQGSTTSLAKAALPERKLLPLPVISVFLPLGMSSGVLSKVEHQRQMERDMGREQLTPPLPFPPAKLGSQLSSPLPSAHVWEQRGISAISPRSVWHSGGAPLSQAVAGQGREQDPLQCCKPHEGGTLM